MLFTAKDTVSAIHKKIVNHRDTLAGMSRRFYLLSGEEKAIKVAIDHLRIVEETLSDLLKAESDRDTLT